LALPSIADEMNSTFPGKYTYTPAAIGKRLKNLGLRSMSINRRGSSNYKKRAVLWDSARLSSLFFDYSLPVPAEFAVRTVRSSVNDVDATGYVRTVVDSKECDLELPFALQMLQNTGLDDCERCEQEISADLHKAKRMVALDTETEPFDKKRGITSQNAKMIGLSLSYDGEQADYHTDAESWQFMMPNPSDTVIFHNSKFDLGVTANRITCSRFV